MLSIIAGLPECGKSYLLEKIMDEELVSPSNGTLSPRSCFSSVVPHGLSSHRILMIGKKFKRDDNLQWMGLKPELMHAVTYSSFISQRGQQLCSVPSNSKVFVDERLNSHFHKLYNNVNMLLRSKDLDARMKEVLPGGVSFVNIIDMVANRGVYDFLMLIAKYCRRQFGFLFLSLEDDAPRLTEPPYIKDQNEEARSISLVKSRLSLLVRFATMLDIVTKDEDPITFIALHKGNLSPTEIENGITNLKKELHAGVREQFQKKSIVGDIVAINPNDESDMKEFKKRMENLVLERRCAMLDLKLSWVFLRSYLNSICTDKLFISLEEVKRLAQNLPMKCEDVAKFLQEFTGCCDILYIPDILDEVVIVQPFVFINHFFIFLPRKILYMQPMDSLV